MTKGQNKEVLYRVVKFEIRPTKEQEAVLKEVSDNLRHVWNKALEERQVNFDENIAPLYVRIKKARAESNLSEEKEVRHLLKEAFSKHRISLFDQINGLTKKRENPEFGSVPRNWQEETLDTLDGSFKSFMSLRKNGDVDARPPRIRNEGFFVEIPGRFGFKIKDSKDFVLRCGDIGKEMEFVFPISSYQQFMLGKASRVKKFILYRDERDMSKSGKFWISIAYETAPFEKVAFSPRTAVYVSTGASSLGFIGYQKEGVIFLWRSDKHWKPKIDSVIERMKGHRESSRKWHKLNGAKRSMQKRWANQQKIDRREVVVELLRHGTHFVVTDYVIRSKEGKLADGKKPERGGSPKGLNWSAQNTGSIGYLVQWLEEKSKERGGTVIKHKLILDEPPEAEGHQNKIWMARKLKEDFLKSLERR